MLQHPYFPHPFVIIFQSLTVRKFTKVSHCPSRLFYVCINLLIDTSCALAPERWTRPLPAGTGLFLRSVCVCLSACVCVCKDQAACSIWEFFLCSAEIVNIYQFTCSMSIPLYRLLVALALIYKRIKQLHQNNTFLKWHFKAFKFLPQDCVCIGIAGGVSNTRL